MGKLSRGEWIEVFDEVLDRFAVARNEHDRWLKVRYTPHHSLYNAGRDAELEERWIELAPANEVVSEKRMTARADLSRARREWQKLWRKSLTWQDQALSMAMLEFQLEWQLVRGHVKEMEKDHKYRPVDELVKTSPYTKEQLEKDLRLIQAALRSARR